MTTEGLGNALVEARKARGLTLRDVERDTRISTKYLQALEDGHLDVLPAPVYARAFMRTYAQYLGLDASQLVQQLPGARPEPELPPLPDVHREVGAPLVSASWMIAGVVVVLLLVVGVVMFWDRGGGGSESPVLVQEPTPSNGRQGAEPPNVPVDEPGELVIEDGVTPDLVAQHLLVAITALTDAGMPYVVVEVENAAVPSGIIFNQSPLAGTPLDGDTVVTILASR
ncbi:MAG: helix-turn-helix domain-containing protein [Chloroflexi bacterium]|nr:helix-turn-helix domain-containing protein [Chloroflexota bacterium]